MSVTTRGEPRATTARSTSTPAQAPHSSIQRVILARHPQLHAGPQAGLLCPGVPQSDCTSLIRGDLLGDKGVVLSENPIVLAVFPRVRIPPSPPFDAFASSLAHGRPFLGRRLDAFAGSLAHGRPFLGRRLDAFASSLAHGRPFSGETENLGSSLNTS